jgi:hypothetical protein
VSKNQDRLAVAIGLGVVGSSIIGVLGFVSAIVAVLAGETSAAATFLVAAALSLGLLANAVLRE